MKTRLFLFDLDGTLVSTGGAGSRAVAQAFKTLHNVTDAHTLLDFSGKTDHAIFREIMKLAKKPAMTPDVITRTSQLYLHHLEQEMKTAAVEVITGAAEFVRKAAALHDVVSGLGTGNLEKGARIKLEPTGFNRYFTFGGFGSDAEDRAEMLRFGHRRGEDAVGRKIPASNVIIIGDTPLDVLAARKNKFKVVAVATGRYSYEQLKATKPDFVFNTLLEADMLLGSESKKILERA